MTVDDPYRTPRSALEREGPRTPVGRIDEAMIDYMRASRPRTVVFISLAGFGALVSLAGVVALATPIAEYGLFQAMDAAAGLLVWGLTFLHCAPATLALARYLAAVNAVARTNDRHDLDRALRRRIWARVATITIVVLLCFSIFVPLLFLG